MKKRLAQSTCLILFLTSISLHAQNEDTNNQPPNPDPNKKELKESLKQGDQLKTTLKLNINGKLLLGEKGTELKGQALLEYPERVLETSSNNISTKSLRFYSDARARFIVGKSINDRQLRPDLRYIVAEKSAGDLQLWCPLGAMEIDELELIQDILDTSQIAGVLPTEAVEVEGTWKPHDDIIRSLCGHSNLVTSNIECKLVSSNDQIAVIQLKGETQGIESGAQVKSKVDATITFNHESKLITSVKWTQEDSRGPSPVEMGGEFQVSIEIERTREESKYLADSMMERIEVKEQPGSKLLVFRSEDQKSQFYHDRDWHVTAVSEDAAVLRRIVNGDFVCQLNVVRITNSQFATGPISSEQFETLIQTESGWNVEEILKVDDLPTDGTFNLKHLIAYGTNDEVKLMHKHYLATSKDGRQVLFSFIMEPQNDEKLGTADLALVGSVEFPMIAAQASTSSEQIKK